MTEKNLLASIEGRELNGYTLHINSISRGRFIEETNFELYLKTLEGEISVNPVVKGKYFSGRGDFYKPWLEISYDKLVKFSSSKIVDISESGLDEKMFRYLSALLHPGAHIMVVYLNHEETRKGLEQGVPAPATPIGYLLWKSGFTWFKDWYFAEGFWEGDVKLQGNKPLNEEIRREDLLEIGKELNRFLGEGRGGKIFLDARKRAEEVLKQIEKEFPGN
jgi:hypothetical protein